MKRKALTLFLSVSLAAALATGCSSSKKETEAQTTATEAKTEAPATEAKTEAATEAAATEAVESEAAVTEAAEETEAPATEAVESEAAVTEAAEETEAPATEAVESEAAVTEAAEETEAPATEAVESEAAVTEAAEETEAATEAVESEAAVTEAAEETEAAEAVESEAAVTEAAEETEAATEAVESEAATEAAVETEIVEETEALEAVSVEAEEVAPAETEEALETEEETEAPDIDYTVTVSDAAVTGTMDDMAVSSDDIVVLYDNDVHGGISCDQDYSGSSASLGYAGLAAVKEEALEEAAEVTTVDCGDAIQGSVVTTESDGKDAMDLMEEIGYDICVPGNHEYDYGMDEFLYYAENASADFLCCNFVNTVTGEKIFDGYEVITYEVNGQEISIGYVGITTPETIAKSTPTYFQDKEGNYIYGFDANTPQDLYDDVQEAVDGCYEEGADMVIALSHLGDTGVEADWSSITVAANTTGISVFLDGHAHSTIPGEIITNKDGEDVLLTSTGTKMESIGVLKLTVGADGTVTAASGLVNELTDEEIASDAYTAMADQVEAIEEQYAYLFEVEGSTANDLVIYDPEDAENRLIRVQETNMGDFLTDAYRSVMDTDIGFMNGGSIRANLAAGDINYMGIITVFPWNTNVSVVEASGQTILDALEMGAHLYPEECGGFMQVSGLTYEINSTIPSSVNVNTDGEFVSVDGEYRVQNVMVGDEPLDLNKTYTVAVNTYYSQEYGDGMTMFKDCKIIYPADDSESTVDHDVIIDYLKSTDGKVSDDYADPYGQGRIRILTEEDLETEAVAEETPAETEAVSAETAEAVEETEAVSAETAEAVEETEAESTEAVTK